MINQDFTEYPEHRVGLYRLLRAINSQCFPGMHETIHIIYIDPILTFVLALLTLPPVQFKLLFDCIIWGMKHTLRDISDAGLMSKLYRI
jgi:exportin-1